MNIKLFSSLDRQEQADVLFHAGAYLHTRQEPEFVIDLYSLDNFFVEVYYHKGQEDLIVVKSFQSNEQPRNLAEDLVPQLTIAWRNPFSFEAKHGFA